MMGQKIFTPKQLYRFSLEDRVPADHLLRQVVAVVDFSFVRRLTARFYSHTGKPSIDLVVLFKMALIGYLYGITSERRLADELRLNLAFMWFIGYASPCQPSPAKPRHAMIGDVVPRHSSCRASPTPSASAAQRSGVSRTSTRASPRARRPG